MKNTGIDKRERACLHWLANMKGVGRVTTAKLFDEYGTAYQLYKKGETNWKERLSSKLYMTLKDSLQTWHIEEEYKKIEKEGIFITAPYLDDYPDRLKTIPDRPTIFYYKGQLPKNDIPTVAIIGARNCSTYGKLVAEKFAEVLAMHSVQIISGLAMGIDGIGQNAVCKVKGQTYAVLGSGVDVCYPVINQRLYQLILQQNGGIISEYIPGTSPSPRQFPPRNRIISGLSDVVLVIEAKVKSGTLITVDMALEQGKEVFAVPGRITDKMQEGCHRLIKQGAGLATSPEDILNVLEQMSSYKRKKYDVLQNELDEKCEKNSDEEIKILKILDTTPKTIENIWMELSKEPKNGGFDSIQDVMYWLVLLCANGLADQSNGGYINKI